MGVNWEAQRRMEQDVRENSELYAALADCDNQDSEDNECAVGDTGDKHHDGQQ